MSPFAQEMFDMLKETYRPPTGLELQKLLGEANEGLPALPLSEDDIDGLCHSFSGRPVHLPSCDPRLIETELRSEGRTMRPFRTNFKE